MSGWGACQVVIVIVSLSDVKTPGSRGLKPPAPRCLFIVALSVVDFPLSRLPAEGLRSHGGEGAWGGSGGEGGRGGQGDNMALVERVPRVHPVVGVVRVVKVDRTWRSVWQRGSTRDGARGSTRRKTIFGSRFRGRRGRVRGCRGACRQPGGHCVGVHCGDRGQRGAILISAVKVGVEHCQAAVL